MTMKSKLLALAGVSLLSASVLAACGAGSASGGAEKPETSFVTEVTHEGKAIEGGQVNYAIVSAANSSGLLLDELTQNVVDSSFGGMVDTTVFEYDGDRKLTDTGLAKPEFDLENNTVTVSLTGKDYKWSDGTPLTIDDYIFAIESVSHKDYTGTRFGSAYLNIEGVEEFQAGTATSISGLEKVDDYTVKIKVKEMIPSMQLAGGDLPAYITPKHIFKDIPVKDWESSEYARTAKIVGVGPFKIKEIVSGESITFEPNEHYYKGAPKVSVKMDIVSPDTIVSEMKAGNYDIASMPNDQLDSFKDLSNITVLGKRDSSYEYISFNLGKYDEAAKKNVMDENAKMNDPKLRQAIAYALDTKTAGETLYSGLYHPAKSPIISFFGELQNPEVGFSYDPEKANKLLDEAGYKDVDGDGIREGKDGKPFKINFAARTRTAANETLVQQYLTWWKEVGLNVELYSGRTLELNSFYELVQANDAGIDMYAGGWSTGYDPSPSGMWGPVAAFNMSRYVSDKHTELLKAIDSVDSFDDAKNKENFHAWQEYVFEQAFVIPTFESESVTAINKRVKYYDLYLGTDSKANWETFELLADKGVVAE